MAKPKSSGYVVKMSDVLISSYSAKNAAHNVFTGATQAKPFMIHAVTDGTSNTLLYGES